MTSAEVMLSDSALASLRREALQTRTVTLGSFYERTPEELWHADQQRLDEDLLRRMDWIMCELDRDFRRQVDWQMFHGSDSKPPPLARKMDGSLTPEQFFERERRR
jgi:hypothetical protein